MPMKSNIEERKKTFDFEKEWKLIASELEGLYLEADKLSRKSPATKVSELELHSINNIIKSVKELLRGDPFIDRLIEFVPAGDNPEYREIVLVLRQMIQGMNRHHISGSMIRVDK
jgi:hypothetical protein